MRIFENRDSYDPAIDAVAVATVVVECNPGQIQALAEYAKAVSEKAGVYSVSIDHELRDPAAPPKTEVAAAAIELAEPVEAVPTKDEGEVHVEQAIQQPDHEPEPADIGSGTETGGLGEAGPVDAHADGELAVAAGQGTEGSLERGP